MLEIKIKKSVSNNLTLAPQTIGEASEKHPTTNYKTDSTDRVCRVNRAARELAEPAQNHDRTDRRMEKKTADDWP